MCLVLLTERLRKTRNICIYCRKLYSEGEKGALRVYFTIIHQKHFPFLLSEIRVTRNTHTGQSASPITITTVRTSTFLEISTRTTMISVHPISETFRYRSMTMTKMNSSPMTMRNMKILMYEDLHV